MGSCKLSTHIIIQTLLKKRAVGGVSKSAHGFFTKTFCNRSFASLIVFAAKTRSALFTSQKIGDTGCNTLCTYISGRTNKTVLHTIFCDFHQFFPAGKGYINNVRIIPASGTSFYFFVTFLFRKRLAVTSCCHHRINRIAYGNQP